MVDSGFAKQETAPVELEEILITDRLYSSTSRAPDLQEEGKALRDLARMMAADPRKLVDTLLETALQLCGADTSGLSVLETLPNGEEVFRWTNLAGRLKQFVGGSTPRNFSPCGVCLDRDAPQLFVYPARRFQYLSNAVDVPIVRALVIPVPLGLGAPATIWILSHKEGREWDEEDVRIMTDLADFTGCALSMVRSVETSLKSECELRESHDVLESLVQARTSQLRELSARLQRLQDEERRRIARELHDSAGQYLSRIQMSLDACLHEKSSDWVSRVFDARDATERCLAEIRTISYLLHPPLLDETGLASALSWYTEGFAERSGISVELDIPPRLGRLPSVIETAIFRVIQQSLSNIHRYSGSKIARIIMTTDAEQVLLEICDEGSGIPANILRGFHSGTRLPGVGIAGMRERIVGMGGKFNIRSSEQGTTIEVTLPLPQEDDPIMQN